MIIDLHRESCPSSFDCDIAIVGAGAVGVVMAVELSRKGFDVVLLEGGGASLETAEQDLNAVLSTGQPMAGLENARFRLLGGSTNFWGGQILRFPDLIFQPRPWIGSEGWPFGRAELDPYYDRCARLLGLKDDFADSDIWKRVGAEVPDVGNDIEIFLTRCLVNRSTAHIFKSDIERGKLRTVIHAHVTALTADESGRQVTGAEVRSLTGRTATVRAKRVVLACGTVEIARLMLQPLGDGRPAPWGAFPWLGRGFMDHVETTGAKVEIKDKEKFHQIFDNIYLDKVKYLPRIKLSADGQRAAKTLDVAGRFEFRSSYRDQLANLKVFVRSLLSGRRPDNLSKLPSYAVTLWKVALPLVLRYMKARRGFNPADAGIDFMLMSEQLPIPDSRISLADGVNAAGQRNIRVHWKVDGSELESMALFAEKVGEELVRLGLAELKIDPLLAARDPRFMDSAVDYYHQMGCARIGASPESGVVDENLRVHGTDNLWVAGAAVFPVCGFANPTYTAMALGLRLSDHLTRETA